MVAVALAIFVPFAARAYIPYFVPRPRVDACSLSVLIAGGMSWQRVIAYNAMAFALQLPMGLLADERPRWVRGGFCLGAGMAVAAAVSAAFGACGWGVLAVACVGNALFHLTAGKEILDTRGGRGGPIGLFISTGALGLLAGRIGMERCAAAALPVFAASLAAVAVASAVRWRKAKRGSVDVLPAKPPPGTAAFPAFRLCRFASHERHKLWDGPSPRFLVFPWTPAPGRIWYNGGRWNGSCSEK